jgi:hypothetical protein
MHDGPLRRTAARAVPSPNAFVPGRDDAEYHNVCHIPTPFNNVTFEVLAATLLAAGTPTSERIVLR